MLRFLLLLGLPVVLAGCVPTFRYRAAELVAAFDPAKGELPEGLALRGGDAYVALARAGQVVRVEPDGSVTPYGRWPELRGERDFMAGLTFNEAGDLFAAVISSNVQTGIYVLRAGQSQATLFASDPGLVFPNDVKLGPRGALFITDSALGKIFVATEEGKLSEWLSGPLLQGDPKRCPPTLFPAPIGVNGAVPDGKGSVWAVNTDQGMILQIPIQADGSAGEPRVVAGPDCDKLVGLDGLAVDRDGSLLIAVNKTSRMLRVSARGDIDLLEAGGLLDNPASVEIDSTRALYITNFGILTASAGKTPRAALLRARLE